MTLHLVKLCVGADSISDLQEWIDERLQQRKRRKQPLEHIHTTRMMPTRKEEILDGGSLYWVIKGEIAAREKLVDIRPFVDKDGIKRCRLVMDGKVTPVVPRPRAAFQGWRYLPAHEAPADLAKSGKGLAELPEEMRRELRELGLL
jgi:hypothetical protein